MRGRFSFLQLVSAIVSTGLVALLIVSGASCGTSSTPSGAAGRALTVAPSVVFPQGSDILGQVATLSLTIYGGPTGVGDAGAVCNASTGVVTGNLGAPLDGTPKLNATGSGCGGGDSHCFTGVKIVQSGVPFVFSVTGYSDAAATKPIAYGCTTTTIDGGDAEPTASLSINMYPIAVTAVCGGSYTLEPPQTCNEPPPTTDAGPPVCVDCQTVEEVLSTGTGAVDGGSLTLTGSPGDKANPSFVWPPGVGSGFYAFFGDSSSGLSHISMRVKADTLSDSPLFGSQSLYLPIDPLETFPPTYPSYPTTVTVDGGAPVAYHQQQPAAVQFDGTTYVAFADDSASPGTFAIYVRAFAQSGTAPLVAQTANPCPVSTITGTAAAGETGSLTAPSLAVTSSGGTTVLLVVWQDAAGNVYGRNYLPGTSGGCGTPETQALISATPNSSHPSVAPLSIPTDGGAPRPGFIVVWTSGSDLWIRSVGVGGVPATSPQTLQGSNHVASFPNVASIVSGGQASTGNVGSFVVVWADQAPGASGTTTYAIRFTNRAQSIDPPTQISSGTNETTPFVAASSTALGSYVVVWADQGSNNQIHARYLNSTIGLLNVEATQAGTSAYLANPYDGTTNDFPVAALPNRTRVTPTAVVGGGDSKNYGGAPYVAFGWVDNTTGGTTPGYGIVARRFPAPTQ